MTTAAKIQTAAGAVAWRAAQRGPVVFTNGVFDLLHVGHVALLEAARAEGSALLVAVRRVAKGTGRPLVPDGERARLMAALACVDAVVLFDEETPLALIRLLRPDVLVKGADYAPEQIVGAREVESRGGRVVRVALVPGYSTTELLARLRAASAP